MSPHAQGRFFAGGAYIDSPEAIVLHFFETIKKFLHEVRDVALNKYHENRVNSSGIMKLKQATMLLSRNLTIQYASGLSNEVLVLFVLLECMPSRGKEMGFSLRILPHVQEQNKGSYFPRPDQS